ncbi:uncharacterized protein BCR38DRAFT_431596 [Pseudomassariella vexata]|uniref:Uncharacterized protein n=1 Tax=Pseudomassariella vexata TaxID=1141098 RepID=A0A1Y2E0J4_9PEZI|nr:uncharacterized protein BCR38DRAFT_431596 [Pseudomassariella vexata]ORY64999.1 hypothetical protein BCR38DRAFT_431596 [Pseudomassariella vexata]
MDQLISNLGALHHINDIPRPKTLRHLLDINARVQDLERPLDIRPENLEDEPTVNNLRDRSDMLLDRVSHKAADFREQLEEEEPTLGQLDRLLRQLTSVEYPHDCPGEQERFWIIYLLARYTCQLGYSVAQKRTEYSNHFIKSWISWADRQPRLPGRSTTGPPPYSTIPPTIETRLLAQRPAGPPHSSMRPSLVTIRFFVKERSRDGEHANDDSIWSWFTSCFRIKL